MKVSVLMPTYNHEKTIAQAIESFLAQQCSFPVELCICDDASTDATAQIAAQYQAKYPNQITFIAKPANQGLMRNYQTLLQVAKGEYVAILESDDYWTDPLKLQKQVDFLDANPEYGLSFTGVSFLQDDVLLPADNVAGIVAKHSHDMYSYLLLRSIIYSPTACFRRSLFDAYCNIDEYVRLDFKTFDYPVWLSLARFSKIHYLAQNTAVYRISGTSISNTSNAQKRLNFEFAVNKIRHYVVGLYGTGTLSMGAIRNREAVIAARILWRYKKPVLAAYYFFSTLLGVRHDK